MSWSYDRRSLLTGAVGVSTLLAGCSLLDQQEKTSETPQDQQDNTSETSQDQPREEQSDGPLIGSDVDIEQGLLVGTQLPDPFILNYKSENPEQLAKSPAPSKGYANRFVNQEDAEENMIFIESVIGRYQDQQTASKGLQSTHEQFEQTPTDTAENGDSLGEYHIFSFENENEYTTTVLFNRYGNILHGVLGVEQDSNREEVIEYSQLQLLQIQRFDT